MTSRKPEPGQSLADLFPEIAAQAVGWNPTLIHSQSGKKLLWRCGLGHEWISTVANRTVQMSGCGVCAGKQVLVGFNDLATTHPELASQTVGWDPKTVIAGTHKKLHWRCALGHIFESQVKSRALRGLGCAICSGHAVLAGFNDVATTHPELASQAVGWDPKKVTAGSNKKLLWRCELGHEWISTVSNRTGQESGCAICAGKQVLAGFNDLVTTHPELALQAVGWDPKKIGKGNDKKVQWLGTCGHKWFATIGSRTNRSDSCPFCSGHKVLAGFNDLATTHPELASQAVGWDPMTVSKGSNRKLQWRCDLGHEWMSTVANRTSLESTGCPSCAQTGFSPNLDGWLYFLEHDEWQMFQIGISNFPDDRLNDHKKIGWTVLEIRGAMDGAATRDLETAILQTLKRRGAVFANQNNGMKFDGWSESWLKSSVKVSGLNDLLDFVHEDEQIKK